MNVAKERILVVESDPTISDLIARQTLVPMGYRVQVVGSATSAIQDAARFDPDLIVADLKLPGLSGKDMLVAFSSQGLDVPIIVIAERGMEGDVIQAFRLGAADFLIWPAREAEVLSAVERVLKQGRARKEKDSLTRQLNQTNQELQRRVRELTTIFAIGKAVISITDLSDVFDKIVEGAVLVTEGEVGWLLTRDERSKAFLLSAHRNLPRSVAINLNKPWDDGLSSLVALSGESLAIHGEPLKRFKVSSLGQSALVVPVKVKSEVVGLLAVVRKNPQPFNPSSQALLEAVADYASIALVNARLFRALEERARAAQQSVEIALVNEHVSDGLMTAASKELQAAVQALRAGLEDLQGNQGMNRVAALQALKDNIDMAADIAQAFNVTTQAETSRFRSQPDLNELVRVSVRRFQPLAQKAGVTLFPELYPQPVVLEANGLHILPVIDGLLSNALRFSSRDGQITLHVEQTRDGQAHLSIQDRGPGLDPKSLEKIFESPPVVQTAPPSRFSGLGIRLPVARKIVMAHGGKLWAESKPGAGSIFHLTLPQIKK
jgi:signal transduction histidine kinase/FixJ family two-component response regulator